VKHPSIGPGRPAEEKSHEKVAMTVSRDRRLFTHDGRVLWIPIFANVVFAQSQAVTSLELAATPKRDRPISQRFCLMQEAEAVSPVNRGRLHKGMHIAHGSAKGSLGG